MCTGYRIRLKSVFTTSWGIDAGEIEVGLGINIELLHFLSSHLKLK